jgi:uncharacterized protein (UPF0276 family)
VRASAGVGLRAPHLAEVLATRPPVGWFEVHAENYMTGGPAVRHLEEVRRAYPVALHGVGLSLGGAAGVEEDHLRRLRRLVDRLEPALVSEHLAWSVSGGVYFNALLPLPYTSESLAIVGRNVERAQDALGRPLLVENPAGYLRLHGSTMSEAEFLVALARRTGCGLLCDVNNLYVTSANVGGDPLAYLATLPPAAVGELHLAGHRANDADGVTVLVDDHGSRVADGVWELYEAALERFGPRPTLIEWDTDVPALAVLLDEARRADARARAAAPGLAHAVAG